MKGKDIHLNEDQLIRAVVDENNPTNIERNHLAKCSVCREKKLRLEQELNNLGRMAETFAPSPQRKIRPFLHAPHRARPRRFVFAAVFAAFLLTIGVWWYAPFTTTQEKMAARLTQEIEEDEQLMAEIIIPAEYALSDSYLNISGEFYSYFYDEFLEFVIPLGNNHNAV